MKSIDEQHLEMYVRVLRSIADSEGPMAWDEHERDLLHEITENHGVEVFRFEWDSGGPGAGAGIEIVYQVGARYLASSLDLGVQGPYATLDAALGAWWEPSPEGRTIPVAEATVAISCWEWTEEELIMRLDLRSWNPRPSLSINGEHWYLEELEREQRRLFDTGAGGRAEGGSA